MRKIVYYVACSLDGLIAGKDDDISRFIQSGEGVDQYLKELLDYDTVIMGRRTYEFGYKFGLGPGQPAYPQMQHYIFSNNLNLPDISSQVQVHPMDIEIVEKLKQEVGSDIYLCGGGEFAGWLLDHQLIDELKIKLNPLILGHGIRIFGLSGKTYQLILLETQTFSDGLQIVKYKLTY